jgi:hypothetical protein
VSQGPIQLTAPIDTQVGGILIANMLVAWIEQEPTLALTGETVDEHEDHRVRFKLMWRDHHAACFKSATQYAFH